MNDEQLVALCKQGQRCAMEQLIEKYYLPLKAFQYKMLGDSAASEDLAHETIIKVIHNIEKYRHLPGAKFSTWLFKIAYNEYLNYCRRRPGAKETVFDELVDTPLQMPDVSEIAEGNLIRELLRSKLSTLPAESKTLIVLRYYNGFSYSEISAITGLSGGKVKWKLHNAVEKLKRAMDSVKGGLRHDE